MKAWQRDLAGREGPQAVLQATVGWVCRPATGELVDFDSPFAQWQSADEPAGQSDRHVPRRHSPLTGMHDTSANWSRVREQAGVSDLDRMTGRVDDNPKDLRVVLDSPLPERKHVGHERRG